MVDDETLDLSDEITKFSVSWVTMRVCFAGCVQVIDAWNSHSVPGIQSSLLSVICFYAHCYYF